MRRKLHAIGDPDGIRIPLAGTMSGWEWFQSKEPLLTGIAQVSIMLHAAINPVLLFYKQNRENLSNIRIRFNHRRNTVNVEVIE